MEIAKKRMQTCCFTGHRQLPSEEQTEIANKLERVIAALYQKGIRYYGAGGALGFDYEKRKVMRSEILEAAPKSSR